MVVSRHVLRPDQKSNADGLAMLLSVLGFGCVPLGIIGWMMGSPGSGAKKVGLIATAVSVVIYGLVMLSAFGLFREEPKPQDAPPPAQYFDEDTPKAAPPKKQ